MQFSNGWWERKQNINSGRTNEWTNESERSIDNARKVPGPGLWHTLVDTGRQHLLFWEGFLGKGNMFAGAASVVVVVLVLVIFRLCVVCVFDLLTVLFFCCTCSFLFGFYSLKTVPVCLCVCVGVFVCPRTVCVCVWSPRNDHWCSFSLSLALPFSLSNIFFLFTFFRWFVFFSSTVNAWV